MCFIEDWYAGRMIANLQPLPAWAGLDERESPRCWIEWRTQIACAAGTTMRARVLNLSTGGCLLMVREKMAVGRYLRITLPHEIEVEGWIAWVGTGRAGLSFAHPLPDAVVEHIALAHAQEPA